MKILALIPARAGSRRLPGKNTRVLGGLPLIAWSIRSARASGRCTDVVVSTDDEGIAAIARSHGASVPWLRPRELATDEAGSVDVALHALHAWEAEHGAADGLLLLQPTSPFRSEDAIERAVRLFEEGRCEHPIVSVSPARNHPAWCFRVSDQAMEPFLGWAAIGKRSQELEPAWTLNGSLYLISPRRLWQERRFLTPDTWPLPMHDPREAIDIDTAADWDEASRLLAGEPGDAAP